MIISASYRTDIPAFYANWFMGRLQRGYCTVKNPYGSKDYRVDLNPVSVDGFVFWTRNFRPLEQVLGNADRWLTFYVQYTITNYPRALEQSVVPAAHAVADIRQLAHKYGSRSCVWRYDPIVFTDEMTATWHIRNFRALANELSGYVDEAVISFVDHYAKTQRNMNKAAERNGFVWHNPADAEKMHLVETFATAAAANGIHMTVCTQPHLLGKGINAAQCIDAKRLSDISGRDITALIKGNRQGCQCHESRDIGAYDTCPHGCAYCYAVRETGLAKRNFRIQSPVAERLG